MRCFTQIFQWMLLFLLMGVSIEIFSQDESLLDRRVSINIKNISVYDALNRVGEIAGCYFIYDSKDVKSDKKIQSVEASNLALVDLLKQIINDPNLEFRVIEKHILIFKKKSETLDDKGNSPDSSGYILIGGKVFDKDTKNSIPFATVSIEKIGLGTISNYDGVFSLRIPIKYVGSNIVVSHLGYQSLSVPIEILEGNVYNLFIQPKYIPIQEVFIRNIDAKGIVRAAIEKKSSNYKTSDIFLTSFYREGVKQNNRYLSYSEAVFKIFKSSYDKGVEYDQVRLLKSRKLELSDRRDTLIVKLKAGIKGALDLDIIKSMPDFLDPEYMDSYVYTKADIVALDSISAYAIKFEQKSNVTQPLFAGTLFIDVKTLALIGAEFGINPNYVEHSANMFVTKKDRRIKIRPEEIKYTVKYIQQNGKYYIHHVRGDLSFRVRERRQLFSSNFSLFLEFVGIQIDTLNVQRFTRRDILKPHIVFSEGDYTYDSEFWKELNIISPEEDINKAISKINPKIESMQSE